MKHELKYVNFYKLSLLNGCYSGMKATDERSLALSGMHGSYITPMFDTRETGCTYNRIIIDGRFEGVKLEVIAAASDEQDVFIDDKAQNLKSYFNNPQAPGAKKKDALVALPHVRAVNAQDILLHSLSGRYVWIYVSIYPVGECDCELNGLRLELPKYSFTEYFPEIYQGNEFFDRYIAVFQSMFLDLERQVDRVPELLDYRTTPDEKVEYLASWLGIDNNRHLFTPAQLRRIIENIDVYQGAKGTKRALELIIMMLTGVRPRIVEYFELIKPDGTDSQLEINKSLYCESANHFCVILNLTGTSIIVNERDLEQVIERYSPLGSRFKVVCLHLCCHTDAHCYLGVNSALSVPEIAGLDVGAFGGHITIG